MNFKEYLKLKDRATKAGVEDSSALKQLLHFIQAKNVAVKHHNAFMREMNEWERNCTELVEREIKDATER